VASPLAAAALLAAAAGCGSGSSGGVPDSRIISALHLEMVHGHYAVDRNPFCSVAKFLHNSQEVKDAGSTGRVIASRDGTVGIEIIRPFAPRCKRLATHRLDRLTGGGKRHHRHRGGSSGG
jgi:hypothetical protein